jgi:hypothetical protein
MEVGLHPICPVSSAGTTGLYLACPVGGAVDCMRVTRICTRKKMSGVEARAAVSLWVLLHDADIALPPCGAQPAERVWV